MKKIGTLVALAAVILCGYGLLQAAHDAPEKVFDIVKHWSIAWFKGGAIAAIATIAIFLINKHIEEESKMSVVGMIILTPLIPGLMYLFFGYNLALTVTGVAAGMICGYFSYIIDDHLLEAWRMRSVVLPIFLGLGFGVSVAISCMTENWQDEYVHVTDYSVSTEVTVKRYTYHKTKKSSYYSWDTYRTMYFFARGEVYPAPVEGKDYTLGHGALGRKDRIEIGHYKWIGGQKLLKSGELKGFKWILLDKISLRYDIGTVYEVEENFFGHAVKDGVPKDISYERYTPKPHVLPTDDDVPDMFSLTFQFVKIMMHHPDFSMLRWIYAILYIPFIIGAIFIAELRVPLFIFLISSTVVVLILFALLAARLGESIEDLADRFSFGGGSSGGGGSGGGW